MARIAKIYDYAILVPDGIQVMLQEELNEHDLGDMIGSGAISVTTEHPFITVQGFIEKNGPGCNVSSILPAVAVVEGNTDEDPFLGQDAPEEKFVTGIDMSCLSCIPDNMDERYRDLLVSDADLRQIRDWVAEKGTIAASVRKYHLRESALVSCWTDDRQQRTFLGVILMGALRQVRIRMGSITPRIGDVQIKITRGMINRDFGGTLYGMEASLSFANWHREITTDGSAPTTPAAPGLIQLGEYTRDVSEPTRIRCAD